MRQVGRVAGRSPGGGIPPTAGMSHKEIMFRGQRRVARLRRRARRLGSLPPSGAGACDRRRRRASGALTAVAAARYQRAPSRVRGCTVYRLAGDRHPASILAARASARYQRAPPGRGRRRASGIPATVAVRLSRRRERARVTSPPDVGDGSLRPSPASGIGRALGVAAARYQRAPSGARSATGVRYPGDRGRPSVPAARASARYQPSRRRGRELATVAGVGPRVCVSVLRCVSLCVSPGQ